MLVNKKLLKNNWHIITIKSPNVMAVELVGDFGKVLPPGTATLEASNTRNLTHPDNTFCSMQMEQMVTQCNVKLQLRPVITDHFPIITVLDLEPERAISTPKHNYWETDWKKFREHLSDKLSAIPPPAELTTRTLFEQALAALTSRITETVEAKIPKTNPSPYAKCWWSKELDAE
ncbi:uncharacterized protein HD556DRAFT_1312634 [Suillus plorans]|uniref:Endonuclease/exonuclease/phosphatase domain-containing protein n=1 Tax=Suillus plorans TaxID=116603 RepID=A0A9P7AE64_9AGAM|nr:uncharacterized protein HD556DRAFT_1312634 [Suillus plorans]KAG1787596.1 hypothetical protein HD556DRAFT_1312634 [Suillus plorans]